MNSRRKTTITTRHAPQNDRSDDISRFSTRVSEPCQITIDCCSETNIAPGSVLFVSNEREVEGSGWNEISKNEVSGLHILNFVSKKTWNRKRSIDLHAHSFGSRWRLTHLEIIICLRTQPQFLQTQALYQASFPATCWPSAKIYELIDHVYYLVSDKSHVSTWEIKLAVRLVAGRRSTVVSTGCTSVRDVRKYEWMYTLWSKVLWSIDHRPMIYEL